MRSDNIALVLGSMKTICNLLPRPPPERNPKRGSKKASMYFPAFPLLFFFCCLLPYRIRAQSKRAQNVFYYRRASVQRGRGTKINEQRLVEIPVTRIPNQHVSTLLGEVPGDRPPPLSVRVQTNCRAFVKISLQRWPIK